MKDRDVFTRWKNRVWDYNLSLIDGYKRFLSHKKHAVLLDLSLAIQAYDFGILMQARTDFRNKNLENKSVKDFVKQEKEVYDKKRVRKLEEKVNNSFESSFENERSKKIKGLILDEELSYITPSESRDWGSGESYQSMSLRKDFKENLLPQYIPLRKDKAKKLQKEMNLTNDFIYNLQFSTFDEIVGLSNRKSTPYHFDRNPSISMGSVIGFLERSIMIHFPTFFRDLRFEHKTASLLTLRRNAKQRFNTVCWRCGHPLFKKDNKHYCTRSENRSCYEARFKENQDRGFPVAILRTKNKCDRCGKRSSLNYIHKLNSRQMQFCSNRCWEDYRKTKFRMKKKNVS